MRRVRLTNNTARLEALHRSVRQNVVGGKGWYRISNLDGVGQADVYFYDEIGMWGITANEFVQDLQSLQAVHIDLHINSPGGDVWDGIAIYNALCNHPASVTSYIDGIAASAASFIAQAGGTVLIARNATMMIHDAEGICIGNASDMTEMAGLLDRASDNIADIYAQRCSTVLQWRKSMKAVSWYVGPEAVDAGLADSTYEPDPGTNDAPAERRRRASNSSLERNPKLKGTAVVSRVPRPVSTACPAHESDTTDAGSWDAGENEGRLPTPVPLADVKKMYGWYDSARIEDGSVPKDACKLPHHEVDAEGTPGAAHLGGVRNALSRLSQSDIPSDEQGAVRNHLQDHLDDAEEGDNPPREPGETPADNGGYNASNGGFKLSDADGDIGEWWSPDVFRSAVATAADQNRLYGFDADSFREIMRAAAENCPAPPDPAPMTVELPPSEPTIDPKEFLSAIRRGML